MTWLTFSDGLRFYPALIMRQFSQSNPISQIIVFSSRLSEVFCFSSFSDICFLACLFSAPRKRNTAKARWKGRKCSRNKGKLHISSTGSGQQNKETEKGKSVLITQTGVGIKVTHQFSQQNLVRQVWFEMIIWFYELSGWWSKLAIAKSF